METTTTRETLGFQAEVKQLLHLMVHSLYGNKEIFLRELVSNASDACDKLRFEAIADPALFESDTDLKIRVDYDAAARTITISDNGIGMSRSEVVEQIGTIAKSGTREFFEQLASDRAKDANLIGQFGVGFYSAFIVSDRVTLITRRAGVGAEHGVRWESAGEGDFTVETVRKDSRGTDVILHLRPDEDELLSGTRLRGILRKYSDHITLPILMKKETWDATAKKQVLTEQDEQVNRASALWARPKSEITEEQYHEFYKHVAHDFEPPLAHVHAKVEGRLEYTQLFYIPQRAPFDLWDREHRHGIKLYVRRVFIMDDAEDLMPPYLRFVRGVIDSTDLPLNVSREILQQSREVQQMRAASTKRVLGLLEDLATNQPEKYATFWTAFGRVLKEGVVDDATNRDRIAKLLRFASTQDESDDQKVSLADYVGRMKEGQEAIYYITADGRERGAPQPAPRDLPQARRGGAADVRPHRRVGRVDAHRIRRQAVALGGQGRSRSRQVAGRGGEAGRDDRCRRRVAARTHPDGVTRSGQRRADDGAADRLAGLPGERRAWAGTNLERILKTAGQNVPGSKPILEINPESSDSQEAQERDRRQATRRLESHPLRSGHARGGRTARRPRSLREAAQRADADPRRRGPPEDLDAWNVRRRATAHRAFTPSIRVALAGSLRSCRQVGCVK